MLAHKALHATTCRKEKHRNYLIDTRCGSDVHYRAAARWWSLQALYGWGSKQPVMATGRNRPAIASLKLPAALCLITCDIEVSGTREGYQASCCLSGQRGLKIGFGSAMEHRYLLSLPPPVCTCATAGLCPESLTPSILGPRFGSHSFGWYYAPNTQES